LRGELVLEFIGEKFSSQTPAPRGQREPARPALGCSAVMMGCPREIQRRKKKGMGRSKVGRRGRKREAGRLSSLQKSWVLAHGQIINTKPFTIFKSFYKFINHF
jgi:hypothetical protein